MADRQTETPLEMFCLLAARFFWAATAQVILPKLDSLARLLDRIPVRRTYNFVMDTVEAVAHLGRNSAKTCLQPRDIVYESDEYIVLNKPYDVRIGGDHDVTLAKMVSVDLSGCSEIRFIYARFKTSGRKWTKCASCIDWITVWLHFGRSDHRLTFSSHIWHYCDG